MSLSLPLLTFPEWSPLMWGLQLAAAPLAYVHATAMEWVVHRYVYHLLGLRLKGGFAFHLREHHKHTRMHRGVDPDYARRGLGWDAHGREAFGLGLLMVLHLPALFFAPLAYGVLLGMAVWYHACHRRSHVDPEWCQERLPWHWEHHFGKNPHANYCLTSQWFDRLMGTRERFPECFPQAATRPADPQEGRVRLGCP